MKDAYFTTKIINILLTQITIFDNTIRIETSEQKFIRFQNPRRCIAIICRLGCKYVWQPDINHRAL